MDAESLNQVRVVAALPALSPRAPRFPTPLPCLRPALVNPRRPSSPPTQARQLLQSRVRYDGSGSSGGFNDDFWFKLAHARDARHRYLYRPFTERHLPPRDVAPAPNRAWLPQVQQRNDRRDFPAPVQRALMDHKIEFGMGLLPEVHRAWVALDRAEGGGRRAFDLLLWDYEAPQEEGGGGGGGPGDHYNCRSVLAFTGFEGPVLTCALVAPRGDRFEQQTLRYVLVVATQPAVHLFGLRVMEDGALKGCPPYAGAPLTPLVSLPTDGVRFARAAGTPCGRIFLAGDDGFVHEVVMDALEDFGAPLRGALETTLAAAKRLALDAAGYVLALGGAGAAAAGVRLENLTMPLLQRVASTLGLGASRRAPLIELVHDHERGLLHTLAADGAVESFSTAPLLGAGATGAGAFSDFRPCGAVRDVDDAAIKLAGSAALGNGGGGGAGRVPDKDAFTPGAGAALVANAAGFAPTLATPLVSLSVVPLAESELVQLVAVSARGARFYFSTAPAGRLTDAFAPPPPALGAPEDAADRAAAAGNGLALVHVRPPPPHALAARGGARGYTAPAPDKAARDDPTWDALELPCGEGGRTVAELAAAKRAGALPPPAPMGAEDFKAPSELDPPTGPGEHARGSPWFPSPAHGGGFAVHAAAVGGLHAVLAMEQRGATGGGGGEGAHPGSKLMLLSRAYATAGQHPRWPAEAPAKAAAAGGGGGGAPAAGELDLGLDGIPFSESVSVVDVEGAVYAVAARPPLPCATREVVFAESGALVLPPAPPGTRREVSATAAVPWRDSIVRSGADFPFLAAEGGDAVGRGGGVGVGGGGGAAGGGRRRARAADALPDEPADGAIAVQEGLEESSVPPCDWHAVRRALWVEAPLPGGGGGGGGGGPQLAGAGGALAGAHHTHHHHHHGAFPHPHVEPGEQTSEWALQHEGHAASGRSWVVVTQLGVTLLTSVRPIDQLAHMLGHEAGGAFAGLGGGGGGGGGGGAALAASALAPGMPAPLPPALRSLRLRLPPREFFSMLVACECGFGTEAPGVAGTPRAAGAVALGGAALKERAHAAFKFLRGTPAAEAVMRAGPDRDEGGAAAFLRALGGGPQDGALLSRGTEGLLLLVGRVLRPFWGASVFITPPPRGGAVRTRRGAVVLGARVAPRAAAAARGGGANASAPATLAFHGGAPAAAGAAALLLLFPSGDPRGGGGGGGFGGGFGGGGGGASVPPAVVLPRFTVNEVGIFAARVEALCEFILSHYPLVAVSHGVHGGALLNRRVDDREASGIIASLAANVGMGDVFPGGVADRGRRVRADEAAGAREDLVVLLVFRALRRTLQALRAAEAIATPAHRVPEIMLGVARAAYSAGGGGGAPPPPPPPGGGALSSAREAAASGGGGFGGAPPAAGGGWAAAPQAAAHHEWLAAALGAKFSDLVAAPGVGSYVVEGLFSRVFAALAEAGVAERGHGGGGGEGAIVAAEPVAALAATLREHCPDFFSESTRLRATALEYLERATCGAASSQERALLTREALALALRSVTESTPQALFDSWPADEPGGEPALKAIVGHLNVLGAYLGSAQLLLAAAAAAEGGEERVRELNARQAAATVARVWGLTAGRGADGAAAALGAPATVFRAQCYKELLNVLDLVREPPPGAAAAAAFGAPAAFAGGAALALADLQVARPRNPQFVALLGEALNAADAVWHEVAYEHLLWLQKHFPDSGARDELLRLDTPYIEDFLRRMGERPEAAAADAADERERVLASRPDPMLLKDYYMKRGLHERAWARAFVAPPAPLAPRPRQPAQVLTPPPPHTHTPPLPSPAPTTRCLSRRLRPPAVFSRGAPRHPRRKARKVLGGRHRGGAAVALGGRVRGRGQRGCPFGRAGHLGAAVRHPHRAKAAGHGARGGARRGARRLRLRARAVAVRPRARGRGRAGALRGGRRWRVQAGRRAPPRHA
jgi:hypothetical protein